MRHRELLYRYKGNRCGSCGKSVQDMLDRWGTVKRLFELDHIDPAKKHPQYENLIRREITTEQLSEADKCVLLCVECHKALHAQNITAEVLLTLTLAKGRQASQRLKGQMLIDLRQMSFHFFSDEIILVFPYSVYPGRAKPLLLTGKELNDGRLIRFIAETRKTKRLRIYGHDGKIQLAAHKLNDKLCKVEYVPRFQLIEFEGHGDDGRVNVWARRGQVVYRDSTDPKELNVTDKGVVNFEFVYSQWDRVKSLIPQTS